MNDTTLLEVIAASSHDKAAPPVLRGVMQYTPVLMAQMLGFPPGCKIVAVRDMADNLYFQVEAEGPHLPPVTDSGVVAEAGITFTMGYQTNPAVIQYSAVGHALDGTEWALGPAGFGQSSKIPTDLTKTQTAHDELTSAVVKALNDGAPYVKVWVQGTEIGRVYPDERRSIGSFVAKT